MQIKTKFQVPELIAEDFENYRGQPEAPNHAFENFILGYFLGPLHISGHQISNPYDI